MKAPQKQKRDQALVGDSIPLLTPKTRPAAEAWGKERHLHKRLPTEFRHSGFGYRQIAREGNAAIYEQIWSGSKRNLEMSFGDLLCFSEQLADLLPVKRE